MEGIQAAVPAFMGTPKWGSERLCDVGQRFGPAPRVRELVADFGL